jgi:hypothetical protein
MIFLYLFLTLIFGVSIGGYLQKRLTERLIKLENEKLNLAKKNDYLEVMFKIKSGESKFKSRVNETVYLSTKISEHGDIDVIYLMDKKDIAIFQDGNCLHTSDGISKEIISDMISLISKIFNKKINDVVEVLGFIFYREEFEKSFNINFEDFKKSNIFGGQMKSEVNEIEKINLDNQNRYDIDEILDKISAFGMKVLTPGELAFLDKYSNEKGNKC